ncbi:hypothetical protein [Arcanobacterium phocae]|uniref:hypothetical protein n=1 Tax=Arcanobacterium phocae TaxID=131112 RepID=UPI001C0EC7BA|nr:hypothetical protein [Arcanobacterium phocae]
MTGTNAAAIVIPYLAETLAGMSRQRRDIEDQIEALVTEHPLYPVLTFIPRIGMRTAVVAIAKFS